MVQRGDEPRQEVVPGEQLVFSNFTVQSWISVGNDIEAYIKLKKVFRG